MSYLQEKNDIEGFIQANWNATPSVFDNGPAPEGAEEWVRWTVPLDGDSKRVTMGDNPAFRHYGSLMAQIFTKPDIGSGRAVELADMVDTLFRERVLGTITFRVPQIRKGPKSPEWFQLNVSTDYYRGF